MTSHPRSSNPRKGKTSLAYDSRYNSSDKDGEVARSINIIALKTGNRISSNSALKRRNTETHHACRRSKRKQKLSLNIPGGAIVQLNEEMKKDLGLCFFPENSQKHLELGQVIEKMHENDLVKIDNSTVEVSLDSFQKIWAEFMNKIEELEKENEEYAESIHKYERYFKQLKLKEILQEKGSDEEQWGEYRQSSKSLKKNSKTQLKILNLQRKIETLNYIIKNYRSNNKEEVKKFEKKVNQFRPTLENQLTSLLAEANLKNKQLQDLVNYYNKQCSRYVKDKDWGTLVLEIHSKNSVIDELKENLEDVEGKLAKCEMELRNYKVAQEKNQNLQFSVNDLKGKNKEFEEKYKQCLNQKTTKQHEFFTLSRQYEELTFKYKALQTLEPKIKQKEETIRKNSSLINRLQNQISSLRSKLAVTNKAAQSQLFNKSAASIETIENCTACIEELSERFGEEIDNIAVDNLEVYSFMTHLFDRTKQSFEKIIEQYRDQLQSSQIEIKQLKSRLNVMIAGSKRKLEQSEDILHEIQTIEEKRKRCISAINRIDSQDDCAPCKIWLLHSGQLNNWCEQMQALLKKLLEGL